MTTNRVVAAVAALIALVSCAGLVQAATLKDTAALKGLSSAKGVFMLDVDKPGRMDHVLKVVEKTGEGMRAQGVTPHIVVVIIGRGVAFLTKDRRGIPYTDEHAVANVQSDIHKLSKMGIRSEACGVALKGMAVDPSDVIGDVHPVGNGFISAIGYQAQGYQLVPVY